jgi:hypothetical protein
MTKRIVAQQWFDAIYNSHAWMQIAVTSLLCQLFKYAVMKDLILFRIDKQEHNE